MRLVREGYDALDKTLQRTGHRGERCQVVLHHDVDPDGTLGPGPAPPRRRHPRHRGPLPRLRRRRPHRRLARPDGCSGSTPPSAPSSRRLRRMIERRDQGCVHPLCNRRRWLHIHHLQHWADGGLTIPANLALPVHAPPPRAPRRPLQHRGRPRGRPAAVLRRPRETDRATRPRLARAPPPRRAVALHPALRRTPRHRFLQLELTWRAHAAGEDGAVAGTPTESRAAGRHSQRCLSP